MLGGGELCWRGTVQTTVVGKKSVATMRDNVTMAE